MEEIRFWRTTDEYGMFSNFSKHPLYFSDYKLYPTSEHCYQAYKVSDVKLAEQVRLAPTPKEAKNIANKLPIVSEWEDIKYDHMKKVLFYKMICNQSILLKLLSTGNSKIIEDSPYDYIWGCGRDGTGQNLLGKCLMETRELFRKNNER